MQQGTGAWYSLKQFLASTKLTISIFFILATCSIVGTLLPQGLTLEDMRRVYSPGFFWWVQTFSLHDLYHSPWFQFLLLLLTVNLVVCSLERLPKTIKLIQYREERLNPDKLAKFSYSRQLLSKLPWEETLSRTTDLISKEFASLHRLDDQGSFSAMAEKGRWSRLMVYLVHLSVLLILSGALMGSLFGFKGFMQIAEGEAADEVQLIKDRQVLNLPFQVRCDDFDVSFYDTGAPKEFRSDLTILANGKEALKQSIWVNDPLTYEGVTFYQASYGATLKRTDVELKDRDSGKTFKMTLPFRETAVIPGTQDKVQVVEYQKDFSNFGPAVGIALLKQGQEATGSWIIINKPDFHGNRIQNYQIKVLSAESGYYTGLQVKRDPGVWVVYFGFTAMLVGIGLCFYTTHRRIWIWAEPNPAGRGSTKIVIAGRPSKNPIAFEQEFNRVCDHLQNTLKIQEKDK